MKVEKTLYMNNSEKKVKRLILEYLGIVLGCAMVSFAFVVFISPYKLVPGGVIGISIVLHNLLPNIHVGTFCYMISLPLLALSYFFLGKGIGFKTLLASVISPFFMNMFTYLLYPAEGLQSLDPSLLCGGNLDLSHDLMLTCILGPIIIGVGEGIIIRSGATSGGSDLMAMFIQKYLKVKFSHALLGVDSAVVFFGLLVIGMGLGSGGTESHSWVLSGYSIICITIMSRTAGFVITGTKNDKLMFIITKDKERVRRFILEELDRTATVIPSTGLYTDQQRDTLMIVVHMREVEIVTTNLSDIDPDCFVVVTDAYDTYGERWSELPDKR